MRWLTDQLTLAWYIISIGWCSGAHLLSRMNMEAFATAIVGTYEDCWCVMKFCACLFLLFAVYGTLIRRAAKVLFDLAVME